MVKKIKIKKYKFSTLEFLLRKVGKAKSLLSWVASSTVSNEFSFPPLKVAFHLNRLKQDRFQEKKKIQKIQ